MSGWILNQSWYTYIANLANLCSRVCIVIVTVEPDLKKNSELPKIYWCECTHVTGHFLVTLLVVLFLYSISLVDVQKHSASSLMQFEVELQAPALIVTCSHVHLEAPCQLCSCVDRTAYTILAY